MLKFAETPYKYSIRKLGPAERNNLYVGPGENTTVTDGKICFIELNCCNFSTISHFLERILMEHVDIKNSSDSKLQIYSVTFFKSTVI